MKKKKIKVFTAFSGYDSQCMALEKLKEDYPDLIDYELIGWSEIDTPAIASHNAVFPEAADKNYGDISKIDWSKVPDFDLFTYSSPCQDWSICGKQRGGAEGSGTRSSLLWECKKTIEAKKPKFCILENVKALVSDKFLPYLKNWMALVDSMGYVSSFQVLNAGDYDIPQGRERVFMVSVRKDDDEPNPHYYFPSPVKKTREITDFLLPEVPEEYYLSDEKVPKFLDLLRNTGDDFDEKTTEHQHLVEEKKCAVCEEDSQKDKEQELMETIGFVPENALF